MTIIACSKSERLMVADTQLSNTNARLGNVIKIQRCADGSIAGAAGDSVPCVAFMEWAKDGRTGEFPALSKEAESFEGMVLTPTGAILVYYGPNPERILDDSYCIGCGYQFAIGALEMGATVEQAVRVAIKHSIGCGGKITKISLDKASK